MDQLEPRQILFAQPPIMLASLHFAEKSRDDSFRPSFLERVSGLVFLFLRLTLTSTSTFSPFINCVRLYFDF